MIEVITLKGFIILLVLILGFGVVVSHTKYWEGKPLSLKSIKRNHRR